jgi:hypothetical protein
VLLLAVAAMPRAVLAGTVYRWTDANGVVHFADVPPPNLDKYTSQQMVDATRAPEQPTPGAAGGDAAEAGAAAAKGPARVVITEHEEVAVGDAVQSFTGKVRNEGGAEAREVRVSVRVVEPTQGDECLREVIDVEPATLPPGATGTFESNFSHPCFHGPTQADVSVRWD